MKRTPGQVALTLVFFGLTPFGSRAQPQQWPPMPMMPTAISVAQGFLTALDRNDPATARNLAGPNATPAQISGIMAQRQLVPQGALWAKGRQFIGSQQISPTTATITFRTLYANATKDQHVVVECVQRCVVKAFSETPG
jgi:hypothetical protein